MRDLPITEELDFHYLLGLMTPLQEIPEFAFLPELFSIIGYSKLITLCKYAGGETITIPTIDQLSASLQALQWFYDVEIAHRAVEDEVPQQYKHLYREVKKIYNARNS